MAATTEEWIGIHKAVLDSVRAALEGLDEAALRRAEPGGRMTIAREVAHVCNSEISWIRRAGYAGDLPQTDETSGIGELASALDSVENAYRRLLREKPGDSAVLYGLARVCLHAIYHQGRISCFRMRHQPEWNYPKGKNIHDAMDLVIESMMR